MKSMQNCENCLNYYYDDEYEIYTCLMDLDQDEMLRFIEGTYHNCPYYRQGDDYTIVKKQI